MNFKLDMYMIVIFYGIIDIITTQIALMMGYSEMNPVGVFLLNGGIIALIIAKTVVLMLIYAVLKLCIYMGVIWYYHILSKSVILLGLVITISNGSLILFDVSLFSVI